MAEKIRIKDIAERAGVSVGTVDRVLHKRPNVSESALKRVEKVLKEMNYQPMSTQVHWLITRVTRSIV